MTLGQELIHERLDRPEDRTILFVRIRGCDKEPRAKLVARNVRRTEPLAQETGAVGLPHPGKAHHDHQRRPAVWAWRHGADLGAELPREEVGARGIQPRLRCRRGAGPSADACHETNPSERSASRATVASSYGRFSSPTMIEPSCPFPPR